MADKTTNLKVVFQTEGLQNLRGLSSGLSKLNKGAKGEGVKLMQEALGISADGDFGPGTERALKEWQSANALVADGVAGPATFEKLF